MIAMLQDINLFDGLEAVQLEQVASFAQSLMLQAGDPLPQEGREGAFFVLVTGKLRYSRLQRGKPAQSYALRPGDFFGADEIFHGKPRSFACVAQKPSQLLCIPARGLRFLLNTIPVLTANIKKQVAWYDLIHSKPFNWLGEEETVKVVCRKHPAYLVVLELVPLVVAWIGIVVIMLASRMTTASFRLGVGWLGAAVVAGAVLWALWRYIDWGNDYYIITDERIVWLERVAGVYDSRQEAPLVAIKAGETKSSFVNRALGFGDVITQTFVGQILFRHIGNPEEIKNLIDQERREALERQMTTDIRTVEGKIRQKIEPWGAETVPMTTRRMRVDHGPAPLTQEELQMLPEQLGFWQSLLARFRTRWESGGMITYRKHLYVLFRMTWFPAACALGLLVGTGALYSWRTHAKVSLFTPAVILLAGIGLAGMAVLWWLYKFVDWSNDIYRVTPDKIIDSERKPLGDEITKSAPLENIIGLDYERIGILGVVLNFGNVIINVGTDNQFIFFGIHNPAGAQRDIFNYMMARRMKKQLTDTAQEQERVSNYIAAYHRQAEDLRQSRKPPQF